MFTQVELVCNPRLEDDVTVTAVYWLNHVAEERVPIRVGRGVRIVESDFYWLVNRVFTTVRDTEDLPVKYKIGTIVELN